MKRKSYAIGNWKMNGQIADLSIVNDVSRAAKSATCEVVVCLPTTLIHAARECVDMDVGGQDCHASAAGLHSRSKLPDEAISILYGGSVNPSIVSDILALKDVDGGLVGGASLKADTFIPIIHALEDKP